MKREGKGEDIKENEEGRRRYSTVNEEKRKKRLEVIKKEKSE